MLGRLFLALIVFALIAVIFKMVVIGLVIAGLIFRTKETVGLLIIGGLIMFAQNHLIIVLVVLGVGGIFGMVKWAGNGKDKKEIAELPRPPE